MCISFNCCLPSESFLSKDWHHTSISQMIFRNCVWSMSDLGLFFFWMSCPKKGFTYTKENFVWAKVIIQYDITWYLCTITRTGLSFRGQNASLDFPEPFALQPYTVLTTWCALLNLRCIELLLKQSTDLIYILLGGVKRSDKDQTLLILTQTKGKIEPRMLSGVRTPSKSKNHPVIWEHQINCVSSPVTPQFNSIVIYLFYYFFTFEEEEEEFICSGVTWLS